MHATFTPDASGSNVHIYYWTCDDHRDMLDEY